MTSIIHSPYHQWGKIFINLKSNLTWCTCLIQLAIRTRDTLQKLKQIQKWIAYIRFILIKNPQSRSREIATDSILPLDWFVLDIICVPKLQICNTVDCWSPWSCIVSKNQNQKNQTKPKKQHYSDENTVLFGKDYAEENLHSSIRDIVEKVRKDERSIINQPTKLQTLIPLTSDFISKLYDKMLRRIALLNDSPCSTFYLCYSPKLQ